MRKVHIYLGLNGSDTEKIAWVFLFFILVRGNIWSRNTILVSRVTQYINITSPIFSDSRKSVFSQISTIVYHMSSLTKDCFS